MFSIENNIWFDIAILFVLLTLGHILMGHFEEGTAKWRRILKLFVAGGILILLSVFFGRAVAWSFFGLLLIGVLYIHLFWLPRHGIHGWTGEPREKYYELRGWNKQEPD